MDHRVYACQFEFKLGSPLAAVSPLSVRVLFSHFVCATRCSDSMETNSGDLPPTWPLPAQLVVLVGLRTMVVVARTKVGEGNGWKSRSTDEESITNACLLVCFVHVF
ncbi:hypothetical protein E2C01_006362 [Portunus trituberculatus]|uniref:Uncharacterized protein n=1 Tax=Portunus trituberculatus TaxID=210409 RepID=A0A5B7CV16_PORTR|nr:hypothetical protein [Portunus trituberculatus]